MNKDLADALLAGHEEEMLPTLQDEAGASEVRLAVPKFLQEERRLTMLAAVEDVYDKISDVAEYRVYKYCVKEDIPRFVKMGLKNLPTICINGEQRFISIIPSSDELVETIRSYAK